MNRRSALQIEGFFDDATWTVSYIALDKGTKQCALFDSVLGYDPKSGRTSHTSADHLIARVQELGATVQWILETHVHADHLSAAAYLKQQLGGQLGIGQQVTTVQQIFGSLFNADSDFARDGRQFDRLFANGETFTIGSLQARVMHTPGHTPACTTYIVADAAQSVAFVGDTLLMPDCGTARCDFPGGDARTLFHSINKVLSLPPETLLYTCHDYPPAGREAQYISTVAEERETNIHVRNGISEEEFVTLRHARDTLLGVPALIFPEIQVNMRAGQLPEPESNGTRYIKIPLNAV